MPAPAAGQVTIFTSRRIITMEPALPEATAVAVMDGRFAGVGTLDSLSAWASREGTVVDETLSDRVLMPGLIDPHVHPSLPAVLTQFAFLAPDDWSLPTGDFPGALTHDDYVARLRELVGAHDDPGEPFITWGYHPLWHGDVYRPELDVLFGDQPVILWHRSFHELILNGSALAWAGLSEAEIGGHPQIDWERGHFFENGAMRLMARLAPLIFDPDRYLDGMKTFLEMLHRAGVTTALDMGIGIFGDPVGEAAMIRRAVEETRPPSRLGLTPIITDFLARGIEPDDAIEAVEEWRAENTHRVTIDRRLKLMLDGAIFSGLAQYGPPGYLDGHRGVWMAPPEVTTACAEKFWAAGFQLHAHTNGDLSTDLFIDILRRLQDMKPRPDHRMTLEHFAYSTEDQNRQLRTLGAQVSANPYYVDILSDLYSEELLGRDRGSQMVRLGSLERLGVPSGLHSDCPMAPCPR